jgi:hypothetical protein
MVTLVSLTFMIANQVLPPVVGELTARGDKALLEKVLRGVAAAVGPPALLVLAAFVVAGPLVMRLAFGPFYESGAPILAVLAVAHVVGVFTGSTVTVLLMTGNQRAAMWISGAAALGIFIVVRGLNDYGNMWVLRTDSSWQQWLHVSKYPPSITYLGLELGILFLCLALLRTIELRIGVRENGWGHALAPARNGGVLHGICGRPTPPSTVANGTCRPHHAPSATSAAPLPTPSSGRTRRRT